MTRDVLPEDLPLTGPELERLFKAAGFTSHQRIADELGVDRSTVTKWHSGALKVSSSAAARIRELRPLPGSESDWNTYLAGVPATIAAFKASVSASPPVAPLPPTVDPKAIAENLAPLLHVPKVEVVAQVAKLDAGEFAREMVAQMPKLEASEFARQVATHVSASNALALPSMTAQMVELTRELAEKLAEQAAKVVSAARQEAQQLTTAARLALREALWARARRVLREARRRARDIVQEAQRTAQSLVEEAQRTAQGILQEAHRDAERITRQARWAVGRGCLQAVALIFGFLALYNLPWTRIIPPREVVPPAMNAAHAPEHVAEQISGRMLPSQVQGLTASVFGGLKVPDKPRPEWLRPSADGKCHDPNTGERLRSLVLRGTCWETFAKSSPAYPCPDEYYDAPPDVREDLRNDCLKPIEIPKQPQAATPGSK